MLGTVKFLIIPEIFFQDMPNMSYAHHSSSLLFHVIWSVLQEFEGPRSFR